MTRPELCVGAVAVEDGRLLLVRRGRPPGLGEWSVPGGRVEAGETMAEAVVRELAEETGLSGECVGVVGWVERIGPEHHFVIVDFRVRVDAAGRPTPGGDAAEAAWVPLEEAGALALVEGLAAFLAEHGVLAPTVAAPQARA